MFRYRLEFALKEGLALDVEKALCFGRQTLIGKSEHSARDAAVLLSHVLGCTTGDVYLYPEKPVTRQQYKEYASLIVRRARREPIAYILGYKEFMGLKFSVDSRVLIPRPETEILVEAALLVIKSMLTGQKYSPDNGSSLSLEEFRSLAGASSSIHKRPGKSHITVCDVCCGSGAVGLSILKLLPHILPPPTSSKCHECQTALWDLDVVLTDISCDALKAAKQNAIRLGVSSNARFIHGDGLEPLKQQGLTGKVHVIASNPPYIPSDQIACLDREVRCFEPHLALDGGAKGMDFIENLIQEASQLLVPGGFLLIEIGHDQPGKCRKLLSDPKTKGRLLWHKWWFICDYSGKQRILVVMKHPGRP